MNNMGFASLFCRWSLGIFVGMIGYTKVFELSPQVHAQRFFIEGFVDHWIPQWLLWGLGFAIPFVELVFGLLIFIGLWVRQSCIAIGFLLMVVAYGHMLQDAFYDPKSHFMPRLMLVVAVLLLYSEHDSWSVEKIIKNHRRD